jgi:hypothetical protein
MIESIDDKIIKKIKKARGGSVFLIDDFLRFGTAKAVGKALERLVEAGEISRVSRGVYARLKQHPMFGELLPAAEDIAKAIAKKDKARIIPTGVLALNALGLSTQVPLNLVYLTDGSARIIKIRKRTVKFKKISPRNLSAIGPVSSLVIQALKEIGKDKVTEKEMVIILQHLKSEDPYRLEHDIKLAPEWIRIIMRKAIKTDTNE